MSINKLIISTEIQNFIKTHENDDVVKLILKGSPFENVDIQTIAQQIKGKQVAKEKFPELYTHHSIIYPPKLNLEQASSQITATYKSKFIKPNESIIDLTGGFGIDSAAFSNVTEKVIYCEIINETFEFANHNFKILNKNITTYNGDGIEYLKKLDESFDWIFIDPARRDKHNHKVFRLEDCLPNVLEYLDLFKSKTKRLLLKSSPLLDFHLCIKQIPQITEVHIVAINNEVKELLLVIDFEKPEKSPTIQAVNLQSFQQNFVVDYNKKEVQQSFSEPKSYLYEPNSAIMKSGFFGELCQQYKLKAIAQHSHLMTSDHLIDFPGRRFEIKKVITPQEKLLKKHLPDLKANVSCRNYPLKPNQIKAKYGIKDGGENYLFFTTNDKNQKIVLFCNKIRS